MKRLLATLIFLSVIWLVTAPGKSYLLLVDDGGLDFIMVNGVDKTAIVYNTEQTLPYDGTIAAIELMRARGKVKTLRIVPDN